MDQRLRELQRLLAHGDAGAEAQLILGRVRAGAIAVERVRLAAFLGHEPSRLALAGEVWAIPADVESWVSSLGTWGKAVCVRALLALGWAVLPEFEAKYEDRAPREALDAVQAWLSDPDSIAGQLDWLSHCAESAAAEWTYHAMCRSGRPRESGWPASIAGYAAAAALARADRACKNLQRAMQLMGKVGGAPCPRLVIQSALVPWLLESNESFEVPADEAPSHTSRSTKVPSRLPEPYDLDLNERQRELLEYLVAYGSIHRRDYCEIMAVSEPIGLRDLEALTDLGVLSVSDAGDVYRLEDSARTRIIPPG